ncbi:hypothetical protein A1O7_05079 [Cladophialophora yegresii CBS 114405]|uniref:Uncharacterized protein n=1 Tax=Cladophialophora yegresii CBS 114405 TaxID=1182544 RepID=W9W8R8_9EURO|nr:uncharacterized protein A1O7_05079 [Cladophialophora yegresii CBS 114405]EXJ60926.1 hypothetical protein A1O7_05079 [Cladophialophora yegresii CBS 114405]
MRKFEPLRSTADESICCEVPIMMRRALLTAARPRNTAHSARRWRSNTKIEPPSQAPKSEEQAVVRSRFDRFVDRTPRFLRPTVTGLRQAPFSHVAAFFLLHELTAVIPLFGLAGAFHYWHWLPPYFAEGAWIAAGVEKFGRYFRKKGWITEKQETRVEGETRQGNAAHIEKQNTASKWFDRGEAATRWVVELATAYAIVKLFLPVRIFKCYKEGCWMDKTSVSKMRKLGAAHRSFEPPRSSLAMAFAWR